MITLYHIETGLPAVFDDDVTLSDWPDYTSEAPNLSSDTQADEIRNQRDALLADSDFTQLADTPVDATAWATYRQALRDIPQQSGFPHNVDWPTKPEV